MISFDLTFGTDVADALSYGEPDLEEEPIDGVDATPNGASQFRDNLVGFAPGFYPPYSSAMVP